MRVEALALGRRTPGLPVHRTGQGPERARRAARAARAEQPAAVAVAGVAGALQPGLRPGRVVVADRVLHEDGTTVLELPAARLLAAAMTDAGLDVVIGAVLSTTRLATGPRRAELAATGALAVDTETAWLLEDGWDIPAAVVRVIVDTPDRELLSPATLTGGIRALRTLAATAGVLAAWAEAVAPRRVLLAGPRSFCAGVERAITVVERAIARFGAPVYVRRQIVHNRHVVESLEQQGAVFVQELDEVPDGATVVFSAHGVSRHVRRTAEDRDLRVVDATCPLVAKVHREVQRFAERGYQMVLIGHDGHDETEGTLGETDGISLVTTREDVALLEVSDPAKLAYITQTTLSPADVEGIVAELSSRFPDVVGPPAADICYATQNRQDAVTAMAPECDLMVVVGSANSSNAARLVEVAERSGCRAVLVDDDSGLRPVMLRGVATVGVTAAASTPPHLVERVVAALSGLGPVDIDNRVTRTENVTFPLPAEVR